MENYGWSIELNPGYVLIIGNAPDAHILNATKAPFDLLITPLSSTTRANIIIEDINEVTRLSSGFVGIVPGSNISIGVLSLFACIRVLRIKTGYVVCISKLSGLTSTPFVLIAP